MTSVKASLFTLALFIGVIAVLIYSTRLAFPEVDMTRSAFTQTSVDASTGAHVHFVNPSNGMEQILCVGSNGLCAGVGLDPSILLGSGLRVEPGQTVTVVFSDSGDFPITSKTMPGMNMIIHVQDNRSVAISVSVAATLINIEKYLMQVMQMMQMLHSNYKKATRTRMTLPIATLI